MCTNDKSLKGLRDYAITRKGITIPEQYRHLKDLEELVRNMCDVREDTPGTGCSGHGDEVDSEYYSSRTDCTGHNRVDLKGDLSLGSISNALVGMSECTCDAKEYTDCKCVTRCGCDSRCSCNQQCNCVYNTIP